jgi:hypothetical protein
MPNVKRLRDYLRLIGDAAYNDGTFNVDAAVASPLFPLISKAVLHASNCDMLFMAIAGRFLKADFEVVTAMIMPLSDWGRDTAILGAVRHSLGNETRERELFEASRKAVNDLTKYRNRFAHWSFGTNPQIPDALLLVDTKVVAKQFIARLHLTAQIPGQDFNLDAQTDQEVEVYEKPMLVKIADDAELAEAIMGNLFDALGPAGVERDAARNTLCLRSAVRLHLPDHFPQTWPQAPR